MRAEASEQQVEWEGEKSEERVGGGGVTVPTCAPRFVCQAVSQTFVLIIMKANCIIKNVKFILIFDYN